MGLIMKLCGLSIHHDYRRLPVGLGCASKLYINLPCHSTQSCLIDSKHPHFTHTEVIDGTGEHPTRSKARFCLRVAVMGVLSVLDKNRQR